MPIMPELTIVPETPEFCVKAAVAREVAHVA